MIVITHHLIVQITTYSRNHRDNWLNWVKGSIIQMGQVRL